MSAVPTQRPAADPNLSAAEKAKLDYQLELDKIRMDIQRKPKWLELLVDKGILAVGVAVIGLFGLWVIDRSADARRRTDAMELEKFKMQEAKQRFVVEKRMDAMLNMETAMSGVTSMFFTYTKEKKDAPEEVARQEYQKALANAREVINRHEFLLGEQVNKNLDRYYEIHKAIMKIGVTKCADYRDFISALSTEFDLLCQSALEGESISQMTLADIAFAERDRLSPQEYLDKHFKFWKSKAR
jgi:hypothetical protein